MHIKERILLTIGFLPFIIAPSVNALNDLTRKLAEPASECVRWETRTRNELRTWQDDGVEVTGFRPVTVMRCMERS